MFTPVLNHKDRRKLTILSSLWVVSVIVFFIYWFQPEHITSVWGITLISIAVAWPLLVPGFSIFFMLKMKRFSATSTPKNLRVAMIVTKAPSESLSLVAKTLKAALAQEIPHDTWIADEDPSPEDIKWYKEHGVQLSCRKDDPAYHNETWPRRKKCKEGNLSYFYDKYGYNKYDVVVQLDADHIPKAGYLEKMIHPFVDPKVGYVAAPSVCDNEVG